MSATIIDGKAVAAEIEAEVRDIIASVDGSGWRTPGPPAIDFHCTTDPLVAYQWAVTTINAARAQGLDAFLESWNETCHVPYSEHRQQILDQSRNFLWWEMDLAHAAT